MSVTQHEAGTRAAKAARVRSLGIAIGVTALIGGSVGCGGSDHSATTPQAQVNLPTVTAPTPLQTQTAKQPTATAAKKQPVKSTGANKAATGHNHGSQQQDAGESTGVKPNHKLNKNSDSGRSGVQPQHKGSNDPQDQ